MSCRVLARGVEEATLGVPAAKAKTLGVTALHGRFMPTAKNRMVTDNYEKLGFSPAGEEENEATVWTLDLNNYSPPELFMTLIKAEQ